MSFDYLGLGTPGGQLFSIVDPISFAELDAGMTTSLAGAEVPVPGTLSLAGLALLLAVFSIRGKRGAQ